jgi:transposase
MMASDKTVSRRRYSNEIKAQVVAECDVPGASVAKVAMSHGINANIVHGWRKLAREGGAGAIATTREFVPVPRAVERGIEVELKRGAVTMKISWPPSATADFTAWTRELLL